MKKKFTVFFKLDDDRTSWAQVEAKTHSDAVKAARTKVVQVCKDLQVYTPPADEIEFIGSVEAWGKVELA